MCLRLLTLSLCQQIFTYITISIVLLFVLQQQLTDDFWFWFQRYTYPSATVTTPELTSPWLPAERMRQMTSSTKRSLAARVVERAKRLKLNAIRYHCSSVTERAILSPVHDDVVVMENVVDVTAPLETRFSPLGEKEVIDAVLVEGTWVWAS